MTNPVDKLRSNKHKRRTKYQNLASRRKIQIINLKKTEEIYSKRDRNRFAWRKMILLILAVLQITSTCKLSLNVCTCIATWSRMLARLPNVVMSVNRLRKSSTPSTSKTVFSGTHIKILKFQYMWNILKFCYEK